MTPSRIEELRRMASEWEFDKRIPAHRAARLLRELLGRVDELERGIGQMRLLAGLPLPPDVVAKLAEADRLRRLFDDAGHHALPRASKDALAALLVAEIARRL